MTVYLTNDGQKLFAENAAQLVQKMRDESFGETDNDKEFMREVAERARLQDENADIATDNAKAFIESLIEAGFLRRAGEGYSDSYAERKFKHHGQE